MTLFLNPTTSLGFWFGFRDQQLPTPPRRGHTERNLFLLRLFENLLGNLGHLGIWTQRTCQTACERKQGTLLSDFENFQGRSPRFERIKNLAKKNPPDPEEPRGRTNRIEKHEHEMCPPIRRIRFRFPACLHQRTAL